MRTQKTKRRWNDPEVFYTCRRRAGLDIKQAADMLNVTTKTLRNWENGASTIPYSAFRLMRLFGGYSLIGKEWENWSFHKGVLYCPAGRAFKPYQLIYLSNYLRMAEHWIKERAAVKATNEQNLRTAQIETSSLDAPSRATARLGAQGHRNSHPFSAKVVSLQEKTLGLIHLQSFAKYLEIEGIAEAANDAVEWEVQ